MVVDGYRCAPHPSYAYRHMRVPPYPRSVIYACTAVFVGWVERSDTHRLAGLAEAPLLAIEYATRKREVTNDAHDLQGTARSGARRGPEGDARRGGRSRREVRCTDRRCSRRHRGRGERQGEGRRGGRREARSNPAPIRNRRTTIRHSARTIRSFCIAPAADAPRWQARHCATWDSRMSATSAASRIGSRPAVRSNRHEVTAPRSAGDFLPRHERQQQHQKERRHLQPKIAGQRV